MRNYTSYGVKTFFFMFPLSLEIHTMVSIQTIRVRLLDFIMNTDRLNS